MNPDQNPSNQKRPRPTVPAGQAAQGDRQNPTSAPVGQPKSEAAAGDSGFRRASEATKRGEIVPPENPSERSPRQENL